MDLRPYIEEIHRQLAVSAEAGGEEARSLAERLAAPLDAAIRLSLLDALTAAAEEITCDLAPGSVEVRLRSGDPEFVITTPVESLDDGSIAGTAASTRHDRPASGVAPAGSVAADDGGMARVNMRMAEHLKARVEQAAAAEGLSVNTWLVRAAAVAVERTAPPDRPDRPVSRGRQRYAGWARS